jgi:uncharacterized membrane protein YbhN (UPF0104 family)
LSALAVTGIAAQHVVEGGWPLQHADPVLLAAAAIAFLVGCALKALGWNRLFAPAARPGALVLATAGGAASVAGVALPGRFDDAVRIAVVRRQARGAACVPTVCLSLFMLGLVDAAAFAPLGAAAAATTGAGVSIRVAFAVVGAAGLAAAAAIVMLPRIVGSTRIARFRLIRWLQERTTPMGETCAAWFLVSGSWFARGLGVLLLLAALGSGISIPLALGYLCASAASAALPLAPAGFATQAGAGAAVLIASGVPTGRAIALSVGTQLLVVLAGVAAMVGGTAWQSRRRLLPAGI